MASLNLGNKNLKAGTFTFGPINVAANHKKFTHLWKKISVVNDGGLLLTFRFEYSLDGVNWIVFRPTTSITAVAIKAKFNNPAEGIGISTTLPLPGVAKQVQAIITLSRDCTLDLSAATA